MGGGRWTSDAWTSYATASYGTADRDTLRSKDTSTVFKSRGIDEDLDPAKVKDGRRESRDSDDNPKATAIMLFTDVTGSMGRLSQEVLSAMDTVCTELYDREPISDPSVLTGGIGDAFYDQAPLQVSQFESDIRIADQTRKIYIEHGGGSNFGESYAMAWLFGALMTSTDCYEKRGQKGFLFTVGDEPLLGAQGLKKFGRGVSDDEGKMIAVTKEQAKKFLNLDIESDLSAEEIYDMVSQKWEVVHIVVTRQYEDGVNASFGEILGDRLLWLQDPAALPELIVSTVQVLSGANKKDVADSWSDEKGLAIASALKDIAVRPDGDTGGEVAVL